MIAEVTINSRKIEVNLNNPVDISIPMQFNGPQPNAYNVKPASSKPYEVGNFIGDTRLGGSCNFEEYTIVPHCNGTHTECVGHITDRRISILETLNSSFFPAALITVQPVNHEITQDTYDPAFNPEDIIITSSSLQDALSNIETDFLKALIIRTLPNDDTKKARKYMEIQPPFFSIESMKFIAESGVEHLLVDIPSVDRAFDGGIMSAHYIYWGVRHGSNKAESEKYSFKTITEMIYVPDEIEDGEYFLNLQIAPFVSDASPSRPVLFKIIK